MKFKLLKLLGVFLIAYQGLISTPNEDIKTENIQIEKAIKYEAKADTLIQDGTYEVPLDIHIKMNEGALDHKGIIEKSGDKYYFTFTHFQNKSITNLKLVREGKVGQLVKVDGENTSYTYTLSKEDLSQKFDFTAVIAEMSKTINFFLYIKLDEAQLVSDTIEDRGERPARYIPEIITSAGNVEVEKGSVYLLPDVKAYLKNQEIEVEKEAVYINNGSLEAVEIIENKLFASKLGEYKITYRASSSKYKTSLGNDTKEEFVFVITSKLGASSNGKYEDKNNVLPKGTQIQVNILKTGETYDSVSKVMRNIADNFQVFDIKFFSEEGNEITLDGKVTILLKVDNYLNRNKVKISNLNGEKLENFEIENHGRYIGFETDKVGTYVAYVEGVEFNMPIWGYVLIACSVLLVVIVIIVVIVIFSLKKKKALKNIEEDIKNTSEDSDKKE